MLRWIVVGRVEDRVGKEGVIHGKRDTHWELEWCSQPFANEINGLFSEVLRVVIVEKGDGVKFFPLVEPRKKSLGSWDTGLSLAGDKGATEERCQVRNAGVFCACSYAGAWV